MWKFMVAGTAALAIAGTSLAYAQQRDGRDGMMPGRQLNAEDLRAFGEARLAALKAGLMLTPEQEKNWPAFEQAARDLAKARVDRISAMRNAPATDDPVARLRQRATALSDTGAALKKLADAADPLYKSLDENQKTALCDTQSLGRSRPRWDAWTRRTGRRNASLGPAPI
jgi:zinc resistance-associated protein